MLVKNDHFLFSRELERLKDDFKRCHDPSVKRIIKQEIYHLRSLLEERH
ncbi:hypothetical protein [Bacillus sp. SA1-12]|nr:hypothetical protein [Bacillus sp. SA1-12]